MFDGKLRPRLLSRSMLEKLLGFLSIWCVVSYVFFFFGGPDLTQPSRALFARLLYLGSNPKDLAEIGNPSTRDSWMATQATAVPPGAKVLDVAAGARPYKHLWDHCSYFSHEFQGNTKLVDKFRGEGGARKNLDTVHDYIGDITNTTAPSNTFDVVILTEVIEHVPEPVLAILEIARLAKPGGTILVTAPFTSGVHQLPFHFSSGYSRPWYEYVAKKAGLELISLDSQGDYFKLMAQEVSRALKCGGAVDGLVTEDLTAMRNSMKAYFLRLSKLYGDDSGNAKVACADQFAIGWMAKFRKTMQ
eukprot:gb/GEZN01012783.1/.p1 GENE.gb/GEZN01012783.1/~~gb/GEZN01012783.1/.p1  ORF type:complete len:316 (+),score=21.58 gb/GEZN01012783.1/:40-948(+)